MSPELITAIKDRIIAGQEKDTIKESVLGMGHAEAVFEAAFTLAQHDISKGGATSLSGDAPLPRVRTLIDDSLGFLMKHFTLVVSLFIPAVISLALSFASELYPDIVWLSVTLATASVVAFGVYIFLALAVFYVICSAGTKSMKEGIMWSKKNFLSLLWVYLLTTLVMFGGFVFFFIPGFIIGILIYFSVYAYILEDKRGMQALLRSRQLVCGRMWKVFRKLVGFTLYLLIPILVISIPLGILSIFYGESTLFNFLSEAALEAMSAVLTVIVTYAMFTLYKALQAGRAEEPSSAFTKGIYWFLTFLGFSVIVALITAAIIWGEKDLTDMSLLPEESTVKLQILAAGPLATAYLSTHDNSFEGVCETLVPTLSAASATECNDSDSAWALQGVEGEEQWCADTTSTGKQVNTALEGRTTCIQLPAKPQPTSINLDTLEASTSEALLPAM